ncbi:AbrB family transcriptional regulator [Niallia endozanthoxylica]|uniref:AbrB family transcriptional regulator n=1 Tax=Niallia endozanthoxylica TaxID=2036016 RepID=A0A5J5HPH1_9BACI|nr:AbrB family transcriptional regulator [Niallia endozanthoxylica]KAA9023634.1 AbrB family transcriptional regulator [Niallia endozanthoxylica]
MKRNQAFNHSILFIFVSSMGGFLFSLTGLGIGWMLGTIILAALLCFRQPDWLKITHSPKGLPVSWLNLGQWLLAIELGKQINYSILHIFSENWITISVMLLLSIGFSLLSGLLLWKFSKTDMITSFFATAPGGVATLPGIADEVGANTAIVSIIQTMRVFLTVLTIPIIVSAWLVSPVDSTVAASNTLTADGFSLSQLLGTVLLGLAAWAGYFVGKLLKIPAPWLVGGMIFVALFQSVYSFITGHNLAIWWPEIIMILSQIFIATSVGSRFQRSMFIGVGKAVFVAFLGTIGLIIAMFLCAYFVSKVTGISLITSVLAFAPGGVAEMSTTAVILQADSTFVVAVQVLRIVFVILVLPPFFRMLNRKEQQKSMQSKMSV